MFELDQCRAEGVRRPRPSSPRGIQRPNFVKKRIYGKRLKRSSEMLGNERKFFGEKLESFSKDVDFLQEIVWDFPCPGHPRTSFAPGIQEPLHATELDLIIS